MERVARHWWFAALVLAVVIACAPALAGGYVYDDLATAKSPAQDGVDDLLQVFSRDSGAYMNAPVNAAWPYGVTYRPLSAASIIAIQAFLPGKPLAHHLVSLALHLLCALGLFRGIQLADGAVRTHAAKGVALLFALHPVGIEAYGYINGRSDVLAGAFVAGLFCALPFAEQVGPVRARSLLFTAACAGGAALSKEPAIAAVLTLAGACACEPRGLCSWSRIRRTAPWLITVAASLAVALGARAWVVSARTSGLRVLLSDAQAMPAYLKALRLALDHLFVPLPHAMLCLATELFQPVDAVDVAGLAVVALLLGVALVRKRLRVALYVAGALASLIPVLPVRNLVWLGFDRYLYIPLFLLCCALAALLPAAHAEQAGERRLLTLRTFALLVMCMGLASSTFVAARAYASHEAWLQSMLEERPDDASGWIMTADWFLREGQPARASKAALAAPREGLSPALSADLGPLLVKLGHKREAVQVMEAGYRAYPDDPLVQYQALVARGMQGRFEDAYQLAAQLEHQPSMCAAARDWIRGWLDEPDFPSEQRPRAQAVTSRMHCPELR